MTLRARRFRNPRLARPRKAVRRGKVSNRRRPVLGRMVRRKTDYARVVEAFETPITTDATGVYSNVHQYSLSDFQRAQEVAHAYKYYRAAKIELIFVPYATQALTNGAAASRMPQLYFTLDRVGNAYINPTEAEMLERGVAPKIFKGINKFTFKPNLLQHVQLETNQPAEGGGLPLGINVINAINSIPVFNKWLPTQQSYGFTPLPPNAQTGQQVVQMASNPYALKYYGAVSVIDVETAGTALAIGDLMTKITWEFKSPRALKTNAPAPEPIESAATSMMNPGVVANTQPTMYP